MEIRVHKNKLNKSKQETLRDSENNTINRTLSIESPTKNPDN